jgi:hypothetical protein
MQYSSHVWTLIISNALSLEPNRDQLRFDGLFSPRSQQHATRGSIQSQLGIYIIWSQQEQTIVSSTLYVAVKLRVHLVL